MDVLAPDVVLVADSGGWVRAARQPVQGRDRAVALLSRFPHLAHGAKIATLLLNGAVAARIEGAAEVDTAITFVIEGGRITRILCDPQPAQAGAAGAGGGAAAVTLLSHPPQVVEAA